MSNLQLSTIGFFEVQHGDEGFDSIRDDTTLNRDLLFVGRIHLALLQVLRRLKFKDHTKHYLVVLQLNAYQCRLHPIRLQKETLAYTSPLLILFCYYCFLENYRYKQHLFVFEKDD